LGGSVVSAIVKKVFPDETELLSDAKEGPKGSRYWMIPGKEREPRWILPDDPKYAFPFLEQWRPYKFFSLVKWKLLMIAYRGRSLGCVPGVVPLRITVSQGKNWGHLGWMFDGPPVPVIYIGTPSPYRKAVMGLIDSENKKVAAIAKVPLGPVAGGAITREAENIEQLTQEKPGRAPCNIFVDSKNGVSTQEFIAGSPTGRRLTECHIDCLVDLAIPGETVSLRLIVASLEKKIQVMENIDPEDRVVLVRALRQAEDPAPLPAVWEHGDFVPWNLKRVANGSLQAIDWEESSRAGLPLYDLVYFHLIQALELGEKELFPKLFVALQDQYLERLGIARKMAGKIIRVSIVRFWLRFHEVGDVARAKFFIHRLNGFPGHLQ
jgi:hypothetical protein